MSALGPTHSEEVTDLLVARAHDPDRLLRHWTPRSLGRRPAPAATSALERLAADEDGDVREAAPRVRERPAGSP